MNPRAWIVLLVVTSPFTGRSLSANDRMIESELADSYHYVDHYEVLIDAPSEDVWPHLLDMGSWMHGFDMLHESGPTGSEGQVLRIYEGQDFFLEIVKIIPGRVLVGVNLPSNMEGEESVGISMMTLTDVDGKTLVSNFMSRRYDWAEDAPNPLKERRGSGAFRELNRSLWEDSLARLKALAEHSRSGDRSHRANGSGAKAASRT